MDSGTLGAISTVLVTIAFFAICFWAFSPRLKKRFEEDARLPFADELEIEKKHPTLDDTENNVNSETGDSNTDKIEPLK